MKRFLLCSTSAIAAVTGATAAVAQETPASQPLDEIIVTGVRASIESAQALKQNSLEIVDAIVAEDIGKLPDNSAAEALQRVTGVQIARGRGDANLVLIRGLPNIVTTLNDRQIFTTTGRGIALADIPADLVKQVEVFKTQSADQFAGGLVGAINVDLRRPLDFDGLELAGTLRGLYSENTEETDPIASGLISNRWTTDAGEFGAMLSVSYQDKHYQEANTFDGTYDSIEDPFNPTPNLDDPSDNILRPFVIGSIYTLGETVRESANLSLQWRPSDRATFHWDSFYVTYDEDFELNFWIPLPGIQVDSFTLKPDSNVAHTWNSSNIFTLTSNQAFARESETFQTAIGGEWQLTDRLSMTGDLAYTRSTADNRGVILDTGFIAPRLEVDFSQGGASNARVLNADGTSFDVTDSSHYWLEQLFDQRDEQEGEDVNLTADLDYSLGDGFFRTLGGGVQIGRRTAENQAALGEGINRNRFAPPGVDNLVFVDDVESITGLAGIQDVSPSDILEGDRDLWTRQWFIADREFLLNNTSAVRELFFLSPEDPPNAPTRFFKDEEDTYAAYVQAAFSTELGETPMDGVLGVRFVRVESSLQGFLSSTVVGGDTTLTEANIDKTDDYVLPSFNVRFGLRDDLDLRFAASKTMVRPDFEDLNPGTTLTSPGPTLTGQGTGGNPNLESPESTNADVSLEWWFRPGSALTGGVFYRDIKDYIQIFNNPEIIGGSTYQVSRPRNTDAELQGFEVAYTQFFDVLPGWWSGWGVQLNYTMIDSSARTPDLRSDPTGQTFREADVTNVSDDAYNAILIYEKFGLSARLAYNWRSDYIESYNQSGAQPPAVVVKDAAQMDFSLGYDVNENVTLSFDATNLLDRSVYNYFGSSSSRDEFLFPRDVRSNDRTFSLGLRVRL
jgi:TonB-dependent receptor